MDNETLARKVGGGEEGEGMITVGRDEYLGLRDKKYEFEMRAEALEAESVGLKAGFESVKQASEDLKTKVIELQTELALVKNEKDKLQILVDSQKAMVGNYARDRGSPEKRSERAQRSPKREELVASGRKSTGQHEGEFGRRRGSFEGQELSQKEDYLVKEISNMRNEMLNTGKMISKLVETMPHQQTMGRQPQNGRQSQNQPEPEFAQKTQDNFDSGRHRVFDESDPRDLQQERAYKMTAHQKERDAQFNKSQVNITGPKGPTDPNPSTDWRTLMAGQPAPLKPDQGPSNDFGPKSQIPFGTREKQNLVTPEKKRTNSHRQPAGMSQPHVFDNTNETQPGPKPEAPLTDSNNNDSLPRRHRNYSEGIIFSGQNPNNSNQQSVFVTPHPSNTRPESPPPKLVRQDSDPVAVTGAISPSYNRQSLGVEKPSYNRQTVGPDMARRNPIVERRNADYEYLERKSARGSLDRARRTFDGRKNEGLNNSFNGEIGYNQSKKEKYNYEPKKEREEGGKAGVSRLDVFDLKKERD